jgi:hypothetical protein
MPIHVLSAFSPYVHVEIRTSTASTLAIALFDTGASITAFHPKFIETMEPQQVGAIDTKVVEGRMEVENTYFFQIWLEPGMQVQARGFGVEVVSREPASPCDILIGRDLMSRWMIALDGPGDRLIISY